MKRLTSFSILYLLSMVALFSQLSINNNNTSYTIDFDASVSGVNQGAYLGSGFTSNPSSGQLDADAWATTGLSDGSKNFGISNTSGDHARGSNDGGVSSGGLYGFDVGGGNRAIAIQPTGSDWTPGTLTLKMVNNSGSVITDMTIDYNIYLRNDQNRANTFNLSFSYNNSSYSALSSGNYTSPQGSSGTSWIITQKNIILSGLSIAPGEDFYIRWAGSDAGGSGSRDEFALDDIVIGVSGSVGGCTEPLAQATNLNFGTITNNSIQASFNATMADKYLVVQSLSASLGAAPLDGVTYNPGSNLGSGEVLQYGTSTNINSLGLNANTNYYFHIFSANDVCSGGPDYLSTNPLLGNASTTAGGTNYYDVVGNETCENLKTVLHNLIDNHTVVSYGSLWTHYQTTDDHLNDSGTETIVWDMYSDNPFGSENEFTFVAEQCGTYQGEGSCYNREHSFPKSWWGGSTSPPQYTDIFTVVPVDGWINGIRSNNPYGEIQAGTETHIMNNGTALGSSSIDIPGYSGSVFEPIDAYKGDLARGYFYMMTRYEDVIASWETNTPESDAVLDGTSYPGFEPWMLTMLIEWHNIDPVDTKEIERNEAIYGIQGNRNPYIDHPEYVDLVWGNCGGAEIDTEAPSNPTNLTASNITETSTNLNWTASTDNVGVVGYNVYQNGAFLGNTTTTVFAVTGLSASSNYDFYVIAYDAEANFSGSSNVVSITTDGPMADTTAPTVPSNLIANNVTETTADLSWNASSDNVGVTGYNVYQDGVFIANATTTNYDITGLTGATTYQYYVTAFDAAGNESSASNNISITTDTPQDVTAPTNPSNLSVANVTETTADLSWNASSDNVGVIGYNIYQDGVFLASATTTNYDVTSLIGATTYQYYVTAFDAAGNESGASNNISITTDTPQDNTAPTNPSNLSVANVTETTADLSWTASSDNVAVVGYDIYQDGSYIASSAVNSYALTGLSAATTYQYYVVAFDAAGNVSGASNNISITTDSPAGNNEILGTYFETGLEGWVDGGNDCFRYSGSNSFEGSYSMRIRDNSGVGSSVTSPSLDLTSYSSINVQFSFFAQSMENNEDFWLRFYDGNSWQTVATYARGADFNNNTFYTFNVILNSTDYNFASNSQIRFQCDASANNDKIYIDAVIVTNNSSGNFNKPPVIVETLELVSSEIEEENAGLTPIELRNDDSQVDVMRDIEVFPNPTSGLLNIKWESGEADEMKILVYNNLGKKVDQWNISNENILTQKDVSHLENGFYILSYRFIDGSIKTKRIYIQR